MRTSTKHGLAAVAVGCAAAFGAAPAAAAILTNGCGADGACTLSELMNPGAGINIDGVLFHGFQVRNDVGDIDTATASLITVDGIDTPNQGTGTAVGLRMAPTNAAQNPWQAFDPAQGTQTSGGFFSQITYQVAVVGIGPFNTDLDFLLPMGASSLQATFSQAIAGAGFVDGAVEKTIDRPGTNDPALTVRCSDISALDCNGRTGSDQAVFGATHAFSVSDILSGSFLRVESGAIGIGITQFSQIFTRVPLPEPSMLALLGIGLLGMVLARKRA